MKTATRIEHAIKAMRWTLTDGTVSPTETPSVRALDFGDLLVGDVVAHVICMRLCPAPTIVNSLYQTKCFIAHLIGGHGLPAYMPGTSFEDYTYLGIRGKNRSVFTIEQQPIFAELEARAIQCVTVETYFELVQSLMFELALPTV